MVLNKGDQGHDIDGLEGELDALADSYDDLINFSKKLSSLKIREDWPYSEPNTIDEIKNEMDPSRPLGEIREIDLDDSAKRVKAAFLGSLCGCVLGKPIEVQLTGNEIKKALEKINEWPLNQYVSKDIEGVLERVHRSFPETAREYIKYVAPDDDINYTIMGMLILEKFGPGFTHEQMKELWMHHLPIAVSYTHLRAHET